MVATVEYINGVVRLIDQRRLPNEEVYLDCRDYQAVAEAIRTLAVRGAPAIGVTAALGLAVGAQCHRGREISIISGRASPRSVRSWRQPVRPQSISSGPLSA